MNLAQYRYAAQIIRVEHTQKPLLGDHAYWEVFKKADLVIIGPPELSRGARHRRKDPKDTIGMALITWTEDKQAGFQITPYTLTHLGQPVHAKRRVHTILLSSPTFRIWLMQVDYRVQQQPFSPDILVLAAPVMPKFIRVKLVV